MRSADIKPLSGPFAALLWEQWRLTRPVLLLPLLASLMVVGLWTWNDDRSPLFRDAVAFTGLGILVCAYCAMLLLVSQPDKRMNLRLSVAERYQRIPVSPWLILLASLLVRSLLAFGCMYCFATISATLWRLYPAYNWNSPDNAFSASLAFTSMMLLLYGVVAAVSPWGERLTGIVLGVFSITLFIAKGMAPEISDAYPVSIFFCSLMLACLGSLWSSRALHRQVVFTSPSLAGFRSRGAYARISDIPHFGTRTQAQRWFEWQRFGWMPISIGVLAMLWVVVLHLYAEGAFAHDQFKLLAILLVNALGGCIAGTTLLFFAADYRLFRSPSGRYLFTRPFAPSLVASARIATIVKIILLSSVGAATLFQFFALVLALIRMDSAYLDPRQFLPYFDSDTGFGVIGVIATAFIVMVIPMAANRWSFLVLLPTSLAGLITESHVISILIGTMALAAALGMAFYTRIWKPGLLLAFIFFLFGFLSPVLMFYSLPPDYVYAFLTLTTGLICMPFTFHINRSATYLPRRLEPSLEAAQI